MNSIYKNKQRTDIHSSRHELAKFEKKKISFQVEELLPQGEFSRSAFLRNKNEDDIKELN